MKKTITLFLIILLPIFSFADTETSKSRTVITEQDGSPYLVPWKLKVSNSTLTDNLDGTASIDTSGTTTTGFTHSGTSIYLTTITDNVGIGTTSPSEKLDVVGNVKVTGSEYVSGNLGVGTTAPTATLEIVNTADQTILKTTNNATQTALPINFNNTFVQDANGNVGIGTSAPANQLNIGKNTGGILLLTREDADITLDETLGSIYFDGTDGGINTSGASAEISAFSSETQGVSDKGAYLVFKVKDSSTNSGNPATERMRIKAGGNVGIGTTNPLATLSVNGQVIISNVSVGGTGAGTALYIGTDGKLCTTGTCN